MTLSLKKPKMNDQMKPPPKNLYIPRNSNQQLYAHTKIRSCAKQICFELREVISELERVLEEMMENENN